MKKVGCLVVNVGTPKSTDTKDVSRYLQEFLMDPEVINLPFLFRLPLMKWYVAPTRAPSSAEKYKKVWRQNGSPLLVETQNFVQRLQTMLPDVKITIAMRYGEPSIERACKDLLDSGCDEIVVFPQYPQYARASTFTSEEKIKEVLTMHRFTGKLKFVQPYFANPGFLDAWVDKLKPHVSTHEHFLFTFHSLPLSHMKGKIQGCEGNDVCCARAEACALNCYRAQSVATAHAIAKKLGLTKERYSISFQSRLGRQEWLKPYTDFVLAELPLRNVNELCVVAPSFVIDCLETLEEIAMEGKQTFLKNGGKSFTYVKCLNDDEAWVKVARDLIRDNLS